MNISVGGWRASITDWEAVRNIPRDQLPPLTREQKEVARKLQISEEDYARSAFAGERTMQRLLEKTKRFAKIFQQAIASKEPKAIVENIALNTWDEKFEIAIRTGTKVSSLRVEEEIVDDILDNGSSDAEQRLSRILDAVLQARVRE